MNGPISIESRSLRALRWRARAPRLVATLCLAALALAGLRAAIAPADSPTARLVSGDAPALSAGAVAEAFTRAYLSWDPEAPELREQRLSVFTAGAVEPGGGLAPSGARRVVDWTAIVAERRSGREVSVVVAAEVAGELLYLAVPIGRDELGFLAVNGYPALVGAPATTSDSAPRLEEEVEDPELRAVSERAVRNYLAGERRDLAADLTGDAVVTLPARTLEVRSIQSIGWALPGRRVAVVLDAQERDGTEWTLRYELAVERHDRWYVRELHVDPRSKGAIR